MLISTIFHRMHKMMNTPIFKQIKIGCVTLGLTLGIAHNAYSIPAQKPLFQSNAVKPIMMLNMSKDHQLYFKVYDDYSDLDKDGIPDRTYKNSYDYYGYFDSKKCYTYINNRFEPNRVVDPSTSNKGYCNYSGTTNEWSGNFLNWASMTRIDSVRKILYGGLRSTDTATDTVLERAFLPHDAHSFAKFYNGSDVAKLTPFNAVPTNLTGTSATGITICNTTAGGTALSQNVTNPPLLRVVKGDYSFWASNERWQCRWGGSDSNGNISASTGVYSANTSPADSMKLTVGTSTAGEYNARVKVCVAGLEEDNCYLYPSGNKKPQGLLQEFGEPRSGTNTAKITFGLMTGSYSNNKAGGILRKAVGDLSAEVNTTTNGIFTGANGAIKTLNSLRIYGYRYADGTYFGETGSDSCSWALGSFASGVCSNWGNPQAEIYLESLRYLAGKTPNAAFNVTSNKDSSKISGVTEVASWSAPVTTANYCAPLNVLQFNASSTSYDGDDLSKSTDIMGSETLNSWTNKVGTDYEALSGDYFIGKTAVSTNELCTAKTIGNLSDVRGTCPDAPRLEGSYQIAGLASFARRNDLIPDTANPATNVKGAQTVRTYGVALAPALPKVIVPVPGSSTKTITILPACRNKTISTSAGNGANCAIVDFKILDVVLPDSNNNNTAKGTLYVNWEDSEQGGDYDQDLWGVIKYEVTATKVKITTDAVAQSSGDQMGFGFVVNGTNSDGFHVLSGINNFTLDSCTNCVVGDAAKSVQYDVGTSTAKLLESPLYYAAKWGGYSDSYVASLKKATEDAGGTYSEATLRKALRDTAIPSTYYFATDPRALQDSLRAALNDISAGIGAASSVATVSSKVSEGAFVYQAQFNSEDWTGVLYAYGFNKDGSLKQFPERCTSNFVDNGVIKCAGVMPTSSAGRNLLVNNSGALLSFNWTNLTNSQQTSLKLSTESTTVEAVKRVDWLSGNNTYEEIASTGGTLRYRGSGADRKILGDLVNSNPVYVGTKNFRFNKLPGAAGSTYARFVEDKSSLNKLLFVGSNDGMLHAFDAATLAEKFAFIPNGAFAKLAKITAPDYGSSANPHGYIVDGPLTYSDVYINNAWRRVVVGTMGAGSRSVFALDVTGPTPSLLFEISSADYPDLGYVLGKPIILPLQNGRWAAIFGNGDSSGAFSKLFVVDLESPRDSTFTKVLNTGEGTGLSGPAVTIDSLGRAMVAYAGDINGNIWRFSLTGTVASNWKKDYKIFKALSSSGVEQPISATPTLGINASKDWKTMIYVGTGKYYDIGDESSVIAKQAMYAIADIGTTVLPATLLEKTITTVGTTSRTVSQVNPIWETQNGWYLTFNDPNAIGERVTTKPILLFDKLIFPTLIPSADVCAHGGGSWLMEVVAVGDKYEDKTLLSPNLYDDKLTIGNINVGFLGDKPILVTNPSDGVPPKSVILQAVGVVQGRESWRQVQ